MSTSSVETMRKNSNCKSQSGVLTKERMDDLLRQMIEASKHPCMNGASPTYIHGMTCDMVPDLDETLYELRQVEVNLRQQIFRSASKLWTRYSKIGNEMALIAQGKIREDQDVESLFEAKKESLPLACLEGLDRVRTILENYKWLDEYFKYNPAHQHQDSFRFVSRKSPKPAPVKVDVVGMGIGGGFAASGLAKKAGCKVTAFEKRKESDAGIRYQTASWTMYESARELLDEQGFQELNRYRQTIHFTHPDGKVSAFEANRCTIVLGAAVDIGIQSAKRCGVDVRFENKDYLTYRRGLEQERVEDGNNEEPDIVGLFCGAHTGKILDVKEEIGFVDWPEVKSDCYLWLEMQESAHAKEYTERTISTGDEKWCYKIMSARDEIEDIDRAIDNLKKQHKYAQAQMKNSGGSNDDKEAEVDASYQKQLEKLEQVRRSMVGGSTARFDYIFTSAPVNRVNDQKLEKAKEDGSLVLEDAYDVIPTFALQTCFTDDGPMNKKFGAPLVVVGGDACVAPNPLAARGATVAQENAMALVDLAIGMGHVKVMLQDMKHHQVDPSWIAELETLKSLLSKYFDALSVSENFVQWTQTVVCNLCS